MDLATLGVAVTTAPTKEEKKYLTLKFVYYLIFLYLNIVNLKFLYLTYKILELIQNIMVSYFYLISLESTLCWAGRSQPASAI